MRDVVLRRKEVEVRELRHEVEVLRAQQEYIEGDWRQANEELNGYRSKIKAMEERTERAEREAKEC